MPSRIVAGGKLLLLLALLMPSALPATASSIGDFKEYLDGIDSAKITFNQTVTNNKGQSLSNIHGDFMFARPNLFRLVYGDPMTQEFVSDGESVWQYNVALRQVVQGDYQRFRRSNPLEVFLSRDIEKHFLLRAAVVESDGLSWIIASVKNSVENNEALAHRDIRIGLDADGRIQRIVLTDQFDNTIRLDVLSFEPQPLAPGFFTFALPEGVDLVNVN